ncbi:MAG: DUF262 and DUF1524 domain-containing protein [Flavobacteriales bacterium]|nr:DUF262 and DUF1524 domain-containing protein [Flavobacteriales bacterium]
MKAEDVRFWQFLEGTKQFIIPVFQRDYRWKDGQCEQLWEDILRVGRDANRSNHFMGSVVHIAEGESGAALPRWLVIDGQQRLTTLMLLLIALRDHFSATGTEGHEVTASAITERFLINRHNRDEGRRKLLLRRRDDETLHWLLNRELNDQHVPEGLSARVYENYLDFRERLEKVDINVLFDGFKKLDVVEVKLKHGEDDPQLIFESLNSTGLDLNPGDLVRNYVLMREREEEQTRLYNTYWQPIENDFGGDYESHFDTFLNHYLVLHTGQTKPIKADEVYPRFKVHFQEMLLEGTVDKELERVKRFARYYVRFMLGKEADAVLKPRMEDVKILVAVAAPVVMRLYDLYEQQAITKAEFEEALVLLESYLFRRLVGGEQTRGLGSIMSVVANSLTRDRPLVRFKVALARRGHGQRFPNDVEFEQALLANSHYGNRYLSILLERLEDQGSQERSNMSDYTIEHVLPQNPALRPEWKAMLGERWKDIQNEWIHRLGNLTLTGYNSTYSDKPFEVKKTCEGGFNESPLRLNQYIGKQNKWTVHEMEERGKQLAAKALLEWPPLKVDTGDVKRIELEELEQRTARYSRSTLEMGEVTAELFDAMRDAVLALGENIREVYHRRSTTFHVLDPFLEIIPRSRRLTILFDLDFEELDDPSGKAQNTNDWSFVTLAQTSGGVIFSLDDLDDVAHAAYIAKQAYAKAMN